MASERLPVPARISELEVANISDYSASSSVAPALPDMNSRHSVFATTNGNSSGHNDYDDTGDDHSTSGSSNDDHGQSPSAPGPDAVPPFSVRGLQVWVEGDGKRLPEHDYDEEDQNEARECHRVSKYVECRPNTVAVIKYRIERRTFEDWITTDGMALMSEFELDDDWQDVHIDNFRYMPRSEDFEDEFEGRSLGRAEDGSRKAGRRKPICEPMIFAPVLLCKSPNRIV